MSTAGKGDGDWLDSGFRCGAAGPDSSHTRRGAPEIFHLLWKRQHHLSFIVILRDGCIRSDASDLEIQRSSNFLESSRLVFFVSSLGHFFPHYLIQIPPTTQSHYASTRPGITRCAPDPRYPKSHHGERPCLILLVNCLNFVSHRFSLLSRMRPVSTTRSS